MFRSTESYLFIHTRPQNRSFRSVVIALKDWPEGLIVKFPIFFTPWNCGSCEHLDSGPSLSFRFPKHPTQKGSVTIHRHVHQTHRLTNRHRSLRKLLGARTLLGAPGIATRNKKLRTGLLAVLRTERSDATKRNRHRSLGGGPPIEMALGGGDESGLTATGR